MKKIIGFIRSYFTAVDKRILVLSSCFIAIFIFVNYFFRLNHYISTLNDWMQYVAWYLVFLIAFSFPYILLAITRKSFIFRTGKFVALLLLAPAIFSWKMAYDIDIHFSNDKFENIYWNQVVYWPIKVLVVATVLFFVWRLSKQRNSFYGLTTKDLDLKPYWLMLLFMVPLIAAASTQPDFLHMYPKLKTISFLKHENAGLYQLLYELSYGSDFFTIELFFRGFLVLAFVKWFGKDAILPMACFYCTIHFGKPLGECISSYFGGMILGIVIFNTRTIFGGLMVHLGIAWLMELGGYLGNQFVH